MLKKSQSKVKRTASPAPRRGQDKWQQECMAINQKKAKQLWWATFRRRCTIAVSVVVTVHSIAAGWWLWHSGQIEQAAVTGKVWLQEQTKLAGFELRKVKIDGLENVAPEMLMQASGLNLKDPMLWVSVDEIKKKVSKNLPEIHQVKVERHLPDALYFKLEGRHASALWQYRGEYKLIDQEGTVLNNQQRKAGQTFIVLAGADVPAHAPYLLQIIHSNKALSGLVVSAKRIGGRRWDVELSNGMVIKLPQQNMDKAWSQLAQMIEAYDLLEKEIIQLDMRIEDRVFVQISPDGMKNLSSPAMVSAKVL